MKHYPTINRVYTHIYEYNQFITHFSASLFFKYAFLFIFIIILLRFFFLIQIFAFVQRPLCDRLSEECVMFQSSVSRLDDLGCLFFVSLASPDMTRLTQRDTPTNTDIYIYTHDHCRNHYAHSTQWPLFSASFFCFSYLGVVVSCIKNFAFRLLHILRVIIHILVNAITDIFVFSLFKLFM